MSVLGWLQAAVWFREAAWYEIVGVSAMLNIITVASSVVLFLWITNRRGVADRIRQPSARYWALAASTTVVNIAAVLPPWWLWTQGRIDLATPTVRILAEVVFLTIAVDAAMYVLHRASHRGVLFRWVHRIHHTDDRPPSALTLFVMHPVEAAGFSVVMVGLMLIWPVSVPAIGMFFGLNLVVGTVAHVPLIAPGRWKDLLGGSQLHQAHHEDGSTNFGFFTQIWDRAFRTIR